MSEFIGMGESGTGQSLGGLGTLLQSDAQGNAAIEQQAAAQQAMQQQVAARQQGVAYGQQYGAQSAGEIASINKMMSTNDRMFQQSFAALNKQQQQLNQVHPEVRAAGQNLYQLMTGKAAAELAPYQQQVALQKQQMQSQLASQMGPGWATSAAGIQAMSQFNTSTAMNTAQIQMQALGQASSTYGNLFGQQMQGQEAITRGTQSIFQSGQTVNAGVMQAQQYDQIRLMNGVMTGFNQNPVNYQAPVQYAGANQVGQMVMAGGMMNLGNSMAQQGGQLMGGGGGGSFGSMMGGSPSAPGGGDAAGGMGGSAAGGMAGMAGFL